MAANSTLLLSLVEEYVSGLQDSKAKDTAAGKLSFGILPLRYFAVVRCEKAPPRVAELPSRMRNMA